jgi:hypothetical protein
LGSACPPVRTKTSTHQDLRQRFSRATRSTTSQAPSRTRLSPPPPAT